MASSMKNSQSSVKGSTKSIDSPNLIQYGTLKNVWDLPPFKEVPLPSDKHQKRSTYGFTSPSQIGSFLGKNTKKYIETKNEFRTLQFDLRIGRPNEGWGKSEKWCGYVSVKGSLLERRRFFFFLNQWFTFVRNLQIQQVDSMNVELFAEILELNQNQILKATRKLDANNSANLDWVLPEYTEVTEATYETKQTYICDREWKWQALVSCKIISKLALKYKVDISEHIPVLDVCDCVGFENRDTIALCMPHLVIQGDNHHIVRYVVHKIHFFLYMHFTEQMAMLVKIPPGIIQEICSNLALNRNNTSFSKKSFRSTFKSSQV